MERSYDPNIKQQRKYPNDYIDPEDYVDKVNDSQFIVGKEYQKEPTKTLFCKKCGTDKFKVGFGDHFIAIKCMNCGYQIPVYG